MNILGIETSCDDTAAAIVENATNVRSSVLSSELGLHNEFGGVVPEIASRNHLAHVMPVVSRALVQARFIEGQSPDAIAVTIGPGLIGSLLVGVATAKALALCYDVPFIGVNHLEGHLHAAFLEEPDLEFPLVVLLVSGGHTMLVHMMKRGKYRVLGQTIDDAAGEAFDKVARMLGLGYPGGPAIDRVAVDGDAHAIAFPRGLRDRPYDFSFSGIKTSVMNYVRAHPDANVADVAASFQEAVVDVLCEKTQRAARDVGAKGVCIGGGVAANSVLRERICDVGIANGVRVFLPSRAYCVDNAAMIASAGYYVYCAHGATPLDVSANPRLRLHETQ